MTINILSNLIKSILFIFVMSLCTVLSAEGDKCVLPERIILNITVNQAHSQAVSWRSHTSEQFAQVVKSGELTHSREKAKRFYPDIETLKIDNNTVVYQCSVVFKGLEPETCYAYRVGSDKYWSEWNQFTTASTESKPFTFLFLGDPQNKVKSLCSRVFREAYKKVPKAAFILLGGDIVNRGSEDALWGEFYDAMSWICRTIPVALLPGNHCYPEADFDQKKDLDISPLWRPQFFLPENGPVGLEETTYHFVYQGVCFIVINGNEQIEKQTGWLENVLKTNTQPWVILSIHQPFYSTGKGRDNPFLREKMLPIVDKYKVDLVLQGHDHTYGRTLKLRKGREVSDNEKGTVYVVSVSGPKSYSLNDRYKDIMVKTGTGRQLFQVIHVERNTLTYESYDVTGQLYDSFILKK